MRGEKVAVSDRPGAAFGQLVQRWRVSVGLTQQELADRSSLSVRGISDLERGLKRRPRPHTVRMLADALDLSPEDRAAFFLSAGAGPIARGFSLGRVAPRVTPRPPMPRPAGSFIGRDRELAEIETRLLDGGGRIVTLIGPAGSGRTRLMLEVAERVAGRFPDGAAYAPLAGVHGLEAVTSDIACSFGIRSLDGTEPLETLCGALEGMKALLLIDDLAAGAVPDSAIATLLERCPEIVLLIASHDVLGLPGERTAPIGPLPLPPSLIATGEVAEASPAVQMVGARISPRQGESPGVSGTRRVAELAWSTGGLPLAIEIAGSSRAGNGFPASVDRSHPPDPRNAMERVIAACLDALTQAEQELLAKLAVFRGGFTLAAAHAVAANPDDTPGRTLELAESLAAAALLSCSDGPDGRRYALAAPIAAEAVARLSAAEQEEIRRRHAAWISAEAERIQHRVFFPPRPDDPGSEAFDAELANIRAAMEWHIATGNAAEGLNLIGACWFPLSLRGRSREALDWALRLAAPPFPDPEALPLAPMGPIGLGWLASLAGSGDVGEAYGRLGLVRARLMEPDLMPLALVVISFSLSAQRKREEAIVTAEDAVALAEGPPASRWLGLASNRLGVARENNGDPAGAIPAIQRALAVWSRHSFRWGMASARNNLADSYFQAGALGRAAALHREVIAGAATGGTLTDPWVVLRSFLGLAEIALALGDHRTAALMLGACERYRAEQDLVLPKDERAVQRAAEWRIRTEAGITSAARWLAEGGALSVADALAVASGLQGP